MTTSSGEKEQQSHSSKDQDHQPSSPSSSSPESAGAVRGLTRSVQTAARNVARRSAVGRVPVPRKVTVRAPRLGARRVAKFSDRISTGLDVYTSAVESEDDSGGREPVGKKGQGSAVGDVGRRVAAFTGTLLKNTVLGTAVFETYEIAISKLAPSPPPELHPPLVNDDERSTSSHQSPPTTALHLQPVHDTDNGTLIQESDAFARTSIPQHFLAGSLAGFSHSALSIVMDGVASRGTAIPTLSWAFASTLHHMVAHGVLFGSYEWWKRILVKRVEEEDAMPTLRADEEEDDGDHGIPAKLTSLQSPYEEGFDKAKNIDEEDLASRASVDEQQVRYSHLSAVAMAGGLAGQIQHVVSYYTETWLKVNGNGGDVLPSSEAKGGSAVQDGPSPNGGRGVDHSKNIASRSSWRDGLGLMRNVKGRISLFLLPFPTLRSTMWAFPPSAVGFIAFEYGKELLSTE